MTGLLQFFSSGWAIARKQQRKVVPGKLDRHHFQIARKAHVIVGAHLFFIVTNGARGKTDPLRSQKNFQPVAQRRRRPLPTAPAGSPAGSR